MADRASLRLAFSEDFRSSSAAAAHVSEGEGIVFKDLGVAVVNTPPDQLAAVSSLKTDRSIELIEPERVVYAIGDAPFDPAYLRGYRDAVNHLIGSILQDGGGANSALGLGSGYDDDGGLTWGLKATGVDRSRLTGKGVRVAVLDTGFDLTHPDFVGRSVEHASFVQGEDVQDGNGHGTHCIGIACGPDRPQRLPRFGVATEAEIYAGKVLSNAGRGVDGDILAGIQWALTNECQIISMSLGARTMPGHPYSEIFEEIARRALDRGSLIIAASGNDSRRPASVAPVSHPANCPSIMAVAALDKNSNVAWFSNGGIDAGRGSIDIAAPGVECLSAWPGTTLYKKESGTSMATPHVAGIAALIAQANPGARGAQLQIELLKLARRLNASAADVGVGLAQAPAQ